MTIISTTYGTNSTSGTSLDAAAVAVQTGDIVVFGYGWRGDTLTGLAIGVSGGDSATLSSQSINGGGIGTVWGVLTATSGGTLTFNASHTEARTYRRLHVWILRAGAGETVELDGTPGWTQLTTGTSLTSPSITMSGDGVAIGMAYASAASTVSSMLLDGETPDSSITAMSYTGSAARAVLDTDVVELTATLNTSTRSNTGIIAFKAVVSGATRTVTYDGNTNTGGTAPTAQTGAEGTSITVASAGTLVKTGYSFVNWNTAANGSGTSYAVGASLLLGEADVTLYAQWSASRTVTYNGNGNTGGTAPDTQTAGQGDTITVATVGTLVRLGYVFAGWNTASDGSGTAYAASSSLTLGASNITLYAQWTPSGSSPTDDRDDVLATVTGTTYHVAKDGNDTTGDGSASTPWLTIAKALTVVVAGDAIMLGEGNWGTVSLTQTYASDVLFINEDSEIALIENIIVDGSTHIYFYGITIAPAWVAPGTADPQDPASTGSTYTKSADCVYINESSYITLHACPMTGTNKYLTDKGAYVYLSDHITIKGCEIQRVHRAISYVGVDYLDVIGNHLHNITGSAVHSGFLTAHGKDNYITVLRNNIYDSNYDFADDYCPRADGANYHGSLASIRGDHIVIRNNIAHDGFNSSGIMTYNDNATLVNFTDIVIEGNLIYDIRTYYVLRFYSIGEGIVVRNNTLVSHYDGTGFGNVLTLHSMYGANDGSNVSLYNNVCVGDVSLGAWAANVHQSNNICYRVDDSGGYMTEAEVGNNTTVVYQGSDNRAYFETGFFTDTALDFTWDETDPDNRLGHHKTLDFTLATGSPALDYGEPTQTVSTAIGAINNGFILEADTITDDAGAWHGTYSGVVVTTYPLSYNGNGHTTGTPPATTYHEAAATVTLPYNPGALYRPDDYTLTGWNTLADGTGTHYDLGDSFTMPPNAVVLYAEWTFTGTETHTITFDLNGGTGTTPTTVEVSAGDSFSLPVITGITRTGYIAGGWRENATFGIVYESGGSYTPERDGTMYIYWVEEGSMAVTSSSNKAVFRLDTIDDVLTKTLIGSRGPIKITRIRVVADGTASAGARVALLCNAADTSPIFETYVTGAYVDKDIPFDQPLVVDQVVVSALSTGLTVYVYV